LAPTGHVKNLGHASIQKIFEEYGYPLIFPRTGGRTSRGSVANTYIYVEFLNDWPQGGKIPYSVLERFWLEKLKTMLPQSKSFQGIAERIALLDAEQFLAGNVYELGRFSATGRRCTVRELVEQYNRIVEEAETDPALQIKLA
jgi:hypothetical protein